MKMNNNKRFELVEKESVGLQGNNYIIVDKVTGVNYLFIKHGYSGGLTPLLDENGKPVVTK